MNEFVTNYIENLATPGERAYAKAHWAFLQELGPMPQLRDYDIKDSAGLAIRIKLATFK
jgi:hypothetical protein